MKVKIILSVVDVQTKKNVLLPLLVRAPNGTTMDAINATALKWVAGPHLAGVKYDAPRIIHLTDLGPHHAQITQDWRRCPELTV